MNCVILRSLQQPVTLRVPVIPSIETNCQQSAPHMSSRRTAILACEKKMQAMILGTALNIHKIVLMLGLLLNYFLKKQLTCGESLPFKKTQNSKDSF